MKAKLPDVFHPFGFKLVPARNQFLVLLDLL
ncbi:Uncharacterised protein [Pannonibacter phragmitetus]|uniref:Uncharacterized protein n=1 Tax=Pannonibacter phragmitetus TaxID=121719 RepID=A0A378ZRM4_9HYPH|nr:Uncharacterised protein [Pannonibacter phragmitetus]